MDARYVFAVRFRLDPDAGGVTVEPNEFETRLYRAADPPGDDGWLFFRDSEPSVYYPWRGGNSHGGDQRPDRLPYRFSG